MCDRGETGAERTLDCGEGDLCSIKPLLSTHVKSHSGASTRLLHVYITICEHRSAEHTPEHTAGKADKISVLLTGREVLNSSTPMVTPPPPTSPVLLLTNLYGRNTLTSTPQTERELLKKNLLNIPPACSGDIALTTLDRQHKENMMPSTPTGRDTEIHQLREHIDDSSCTSKKIKMQRKKLLKKKSETELEGKRKGKEDERKKERR